MTPNYVDSSPTGTVVSPWCSCRGSGNMEEECEKFLRDFTENPCLRKSSRSSHGPHVRGPRGLPQLSLCLHGTAGSLGLLSRRCLWSLCFGLLESHTGAPRASLTLPLEALSPW